ncbi:Nramp family divalent metal transporter [bacterium]|nr:Nramp family divalent metal transporter [bacterium]
MDGTSRTSQVLKSLGPGLIWAAAAIGVSHLVQSTRAGATFGFGIVWAVLVANVFKYPFFEYGPRYAAATGESLLEGYRRLGKWPIAIYIILSLGTTFTILAAVTIVTGSLATQLFTDSLSAVNYSIIILFICVIVLLIGRYPLLDSLIKVIVGILALSSLLAVLVALNHPAERAHDFVAPDLWTMAGISFLVALIGWMPSAIDISVWHSLWTLERVKQTKYRPSVRDALLDFNIGYIGTAVIAMFFLGLGALVMYGTGETFSASGTVFANQLISLYTRSLGGWTAPIIKIAAFTTMFSTTITCVDAFSRVLRRLTGIVAPRSVPARFDMPLYLVWMVVVVAGAIMLLTTFQAGMTGMVDLATTLSFLTAPVLGYLNLKVVTAAHMPATARPKPWLHVLSWIGIVFGAVLGVVFLYWRFFYVGG